MVNKPEVQSRQVQRTCSWIMEALLILIDEKPYSKITVSDITEKAGIARQTFYRNFKDKDEVILSYVADIVFTDVLTVESVREKNKNENIIMTFNIKQMIQRRMNLKKMLSITEIEKLFFEKFNEWGNMVMDNRGIKLKREDLFLYRYKMCYQIPGIHRVLLDWFKNDMPVPVEKLTAILNYFTIDTSARYKHIPNIQIRIIDV